MVNKKHWNKRMAKFELRGTLLQRGRNGLYYYRLQVSPGKRKEFPLKTANYDEACQKASAIDAVRDAPNRDIALAQMQVYKGFSRLQTSLPLPEIWETYSHHPDRATPHTVSEQLAYQTTCNEFIHFVTNPFPSTKGKKKIKHTMISS